MQDSRFSDNDVSKRDVPSFIEPRPPLISNPFMRPRPQKGTNLLEFFEEDSEYEEPELVQVYLRIKPCNVPCHLYEVRSDRCLITSLDTATAGHGRRTQHHVSKMYTFSHIFQENATQKELFERVVKDNLKRVPEGQSFTLLTYGASGSGKTYTLMGTVGAPGLVPRSLEYIFKLLEASQKPLYKPTENGSEKLNNFEQEQELQYVRKLQALAVPQKDKYKRMSIQLHSDLTVSSFDISCKTRYYVWVSFVEIYNEGIYDLLVPGDRRTASKLRIREDSNGNVYVKGVSQAFVRSGSEAYDVLVAGKHNLQVAATGIHAQSSRSHCIFTITVLAENESGVRASCVRLCDLAGCERARRTRNAGARLQESRAINTSLHVLERCVAALRRARPGVVPYRESKLTRLLGSGLSGRGEAVSMVVTLHPSPADTHETKHVLALAAQAKDIQINHTIPESTLESTVSTTDTSIAVNAEVIKLRTDNERLHFELIRAQARNKELLCSMEDKQQKAADTMRELVEEAKDMTRQYYEARLKALQDEMDDMVEEYESKLNQVVAPAAIKKTPSRALQNKVAQLLAEITILEEKLTMEQLARARAEQEVQHLRACIDERDEKTFEENTSEVKNPDVDLLTDSEHDSETENDDPCNESLEPTFRKEEINKSKLIRLSLANMTLDDGNTDKKTEENPDLNNSEKTLKDDDSVANITAKESLENGDESASVNITHGKIENSVTQNNKIYESYDNEEKFVSPKPQSTDSLQRGTYFVKEDRFSYGNTEKVTFHKTKTSFDSMLDSSEDNNEVLLSSSYKSKLLRETYFVSDPKVDKDKYAITNKPQIDKELESDDTNKIEVNKNCTEKSQTSDFDDFEIPDKISDMLVSKIINSVKKKKDSDSSLAQFEQLEKAANNVKENEVEPEIIDVKINKDKEYFTEDGESSKDHTPQDKDKKAFFDDIYENIDKVKKVEPIKRNIKLPFDEFRSPSIVRDDVTNDYNPNSVTRILLSSLHKNKSLREKHESIDIFESPDLVKIKEKEPELETTRQSVAKLELKDEVKNDSAKVTKKLGRASTVDTKENVFKVPSDYNLSETQDIKENNTIDEFENIYKDITAPRATEFDLLVAQELDTTENTQNATQPETKKSEMETDETKYNLRNKVPKTRSDRRKNTETKKEEVEELLESIYKSETKSKRKPNLRLRKVKNKSDDNGPEKEVAFKDIGNLQNEFSDVTLDVPAPVKEVKDIESPEKVMNEDENLPPYDIQSCPSKSVTRSRRKLFTPRAEPLEDSLGHTGDSSERIRVPRPSYHRPRARRKL